MATLNKVILIGNLTRDPEIKHTAKGNVVAEFGLAVNRSFTSDQGEKREEVTFIDVSAWGKTAQLAGQDLAKGRQVLVEGILQLNTWDDKQTGQKRSKLSVVVENLQFLGSRGPPQTLGRYHRPLAIHLHHGSHFSRKRMRMTFPIELHVVD